MNNQGRSRSPEELMGEQLLLQIPSNPTKEEIVEILSKGPAVISYISNIMYEIKNQISMKKLLLDKQKKVYELRLSQQRLSTVAKYKEAIQKHLAMERSEIRRMSEETGMSTAEAKEILKHQRPEKPTANDLKDTSIVRERAFYDLEIHPLEEDVLILEKNYEEMKVKHNLFENNFRASQSIKGLIQNDDSRYN